MFRQMEKLIELLNEYNDNKEGTRIGFITTVHIDGVPTPYELGKSDLLRWEDKIISKKFGFIKWLVENEKIEYRKIIEKEIEVGFKLVRIKDYPNKIMEEDVEELLMLLSIQDEPIEFLVSILK